MNVELIDKLLLMGETHPRTALVTAYGEGRLRGIKEAQPAESHDWYCGCGHWNGANLEICAMCGRTPSESITEQ